MHLQVTLPRSILMAALACTALTACTSPTRRSEDEVSAPVALTTSSHQETVVILGTNDIHGALAPMAFKSREEDGTAPIPYERGGAAILASHVKRLRRQFSGHLLWLDAGDEFQGSIESNSAEGAPMVSFFNSSGLDAAAIGNHEFDFGPVGPEGTAGDPQGALRARLSDAHYPYLSANLQDPATGKLPAWQNLEGSRIFQVGNLKVGVIGLSTLETPTTTRAQNVANLKFGSLKDTTLREAAALRGQGADIVVATAHVGLKCDPGKVPAGHRVRSPKDAQGECRPKDEMVRLLNELPTGTLDAVVAGHSHQVVHHWVNGVPVIQAGARGHLYNLIYLTYDRKLHKVIPEQTRIEGPVPVCPRVFANQQDCDGERPAPHGGRGALVLPKLHGQEIKPDEATTTFLAPIFARTDNEKKHVVGHAARPIDHIRSGESPLGDIVTDALRVGMKTDFALMNAGGIRSGLEQGAITFEDVFRAFPFDNFASVITLTGKELKTLIRVAESGSRGYFPVSGLKLKLLDLSVDAKATDLNGDGKLEPWEADRLLDIRTSNDEKIDDQRTYTLATVDFLVTGGDDLGWAMSRIPASRIRLASGPLVRDLVIAQIGKPKELNSVDQPIVDPSNRRLVLVKDDGKKKKGKGRHHRRSSRRRKH